MNNPIVKNLFNKPISSKLKEFEVSIDTQIINQDDQIERVNLLVIDKTKDKLVNRTKFLKSVKSKNKILNKIQDKIDEDPESKENKEKRKKEAINKLIIKPGQKKKLKEKQTDLTVAAINEIKSIQIGDEIIENRIPIDKQSPPIIKSAYFANNREKFIVFINNMFKKYRKEVIQEGEETCDNRNKSSEKSLFTHQKIVRDYINLYTPYRGALLYHGLGSGKTCSSIAIAENIIKNTSVILAESMITSKKIVVLTPASLRTNYIEELKNCGNPLYKKKQFWEFINITQNPELTEILSSTLNLPIAFIQSMGGAWLVNAQKESNYDKLDEIQKKSLNGQLLQMIEQKFSFYNYNGDLARKNKISELTSAFTINMFDNKVVIIDEAHNFVSRIVNKIDKPSESTDSSGQFKPTHASTILYDQLMSAKNCKIVLLTGTPIINYPNELGVLFNILRGYIKTWHIPINETRELKGRITIELLNKILSGIKNLDYISYNSNILSITRNPFGFINVTQKNELKGIKLDSKGDIVDDELFINQIIKTLIKNNIESVKNNIKITLTRALPDKLDDFNNKFIDSDKGDLKNVDIFKRRIIGLTSYLNDKENLMPKYNDNDDFHVQHIEMSDFQFSKYQDVRNAEIDKDKNKRRKGIFNDSASSYRIFSRSYCNFVFPEDYPRPFPNDGGINENIDVFQDEDDIDGLTDKEKNQNIDGVVSVDEIKKPEPEVLSYKQKLRNSLDFLSLNADKYLNIDALEMYSPKFLHVLQNILNKENIGLHLLYSQFRTIEGLGIFSLVLKANGFIQFKLKKNSSGQYILDIPEGIIVSQRMFAMYTGTESLEEKELIRNIYNGDWDLLPINLTKQLQAISSNNNVGDIIKLMMITSSGAEGISLKNTRFVHIMEPYWHPVRIEQVIGRARRICSHEKLEEPLRNVKVILYIMKFTENQVKTASKQLQRFDMSRFDKDNKYPITTDQNLYELANRKRNIHKQLLKCVKETAIDCAIQFKSDNTENIKCYSFAGETDPNVFAYRPNIIDEETDTSIQKANIDYNIFKARRYTADGIDYAIKMNDDGSKTDLLYDIDMYKKAKNDPDIRLEPVAKIVKDEFGNDKLDFN